jgi:predicted CxxxxCH...CXXCH cytochrome family protein
MRKGRWSAFGGSHRKIVLFVYSVILVLAFAAGAGADDCQCIICHGPNGPHSGGFPSGCNICHGDPPLTNQPGADGLVFMPSPTGAATPGAHAKHATESGYNFTCDTCHFNGMPVTLIAESPQKLQIGFNYLGMGGGTYDGFILQSPYTYDATGGTAVTTNGTMTCSNIYCHSNGTSVSSGIVAQSTSPSWDTTGPLPCNTCHGYPPQYAQDQPKSNSHVIHVQQLSQNSWFNCGTCHYSTTTDGVTITNTANHVNGRYDVNPSPDVTFTYTYDRGGGTCTNITCHGSPGHPGYINVWGGIVLQPTISMSLGAACYQVNFSGGPGGYPGTAPYTYSWDFGDGTNGEGAQVSHIYANGDSRFVRLTVTDSKFHQGSTIAPVVPASANVPPVAGRTVSVSGLTATLTDLSYDTDYNGCGHSGGPGMIRINWGDGSALLYQSLNLTDSPSNAVFTHSYVCSGSCMYTIQHSVTDNSGAVASSQNVSVTVPTTMGISGKVMHPNGSAFPFIRVTLYLAGTTSQYGSAIQTSYPAGTYSFTSLPGRCYDVKPSASNYTFTPSSQTVCSDAGNVNFTSDH